MTGALERHSMSGGMLTSTVAVADNARTIDVTIHAVLLFFKTRSARNQYGI
jgi:hypothetical protein